MLKRFYETYREKLEVERTAVESSLNTAGEEMIRGLRARRMALINAVYTLDELYKTFDPNEWDESEEMNG